MNDVGIMSSKQILSKRLFGFTFDFACIMLSWIAINLSFRSFMFSLHDHLKTYSIFQFESNFLIFSVATIFPLCFIGYFTVNYYMTNGSSIGKILMGIRFETNNNLTLEFCFRRATLQFFSYILFSIPNLVSFFTDDNKSFIDLILKTKHFEIDPLENEGGVLIFPKEEWDQEYSQDQAA